MFDYTSILLNETLDEPSCTNVPNNWKEYFENKEMADVLFFILKCDIPSSSSSLIKSRASACLSEIANVRQSIFTNQESRVEFVKGMATNLIALFQSPAK